MPVIAKELGLMIPSYKVRSESDLDTWVAAVFYETGKFPNQRKKEQKRRELRKRYKNEKV